MTEMWIVIQREFHERIRSRSFLISTILTPIFLGAVFLFPVILDDDSDEVRLVIVDETAAGAGAQLREILNTSEDDGTRFTVEAVRRPEPGLADTLDSRVRADSIDGWLRLPANFIESGEAVYRASNPNDRDVLRPLRVAASRAVIEARLAAADLDVSLASRLLRPAEIETSEVARPGEPDEVSEDSSTAVFVYVLSLVLYLVIIMYGVQVMQSAQEERTNRIAEVLMSTMRASHLMAGKIIAVGAVAILQFTLWGALVAIVFLRREWIASYLDIPPDFLAGFELSIGTVALLLLFTLLGFFLYASLFAAAGAATDTMQDANQFTWILIAPLIVPMILQGEIASNPRGPLATILGWIPLTSPIVMPMRIGATDVPAWEVLVSLLLLMLGVATGAWAAGRIYRVGILSSGKRPGIRELWRWVRTA